MSETRKAQTKRRPSPDKADHSIAALYRLLIESVTDYAIFVLDPAGNVLSWNPGAERLKGWTADEIVGRNFENFYTTSDRAAAKPRAMLRTAMEEGRAEDEGWRVRKDGSQFWASVVITRLQDASGAAIGFAKITRDLTAHRAREEDVRRRVAAEAAHQEAERRAGEFARLNEELHGQAMELETQTEEAQALAEELEQANETLQETLSAAENAREQADRANQAKADFLRTVSHELRTPLNAIEGYVQLLQMGIPDQATPGQLAHLARIQSAERHLLSLVNNVLNLARIEAGHVEARVDAVPVRELWDTIEPLVAPQIRAKGLGYEIGPSDPQTLVRADREKAVQVLLNLVTNAIKFTRVGGRISLDTDVGDREVALRVRDTGVGIRADRLESIFDAFAHGTARPLTSEVGGFGLGLSISRELARLMGGDVTVESTPGVGSTFTLRLPNAT